MDHCVECQVCHMFYDVTMNSGYKNKCKNCYKKEWVQNNKEKTKKSDRISQWKSNGLISDNYDQVYQLYLDSTHCDKCGCQYTKQNCKHMDHCHTTGKFRAIVCCLCNANMLDRTKPTTNKSGHKNIYYDKREKKYKYQKKYYGKLLRKQFKTLSQALCWKYIMLLRLKAGHFD